MCVHAPLGLSESPGCPHTSFSPNPVLIIEACCVRVVVQAR